MAKVEKVDRALPIFKIRKIPRVIFFCLKCGEKRASSVLVNPRAKQDIGVGTRAIFFLLLLFCIYLFLTFFADILQSWVVIVNNRHNRSDRGQTLSPTLYLYAHYAIQNVTESRILYFMYRNATRLALSDPICIECNVKWQYIRCYLIKIVFIS